MLNVRQKRFALNIFNGMSQREAYIDAYHPTGAVETIDANASALVSNSKVAKRLEELLGSVENSAVATVQERKEMLTGIMRGDITDYIKDGQPYIDKDTVNTGAISSYTVTESLQGQVTKRIKMDNRIEAVRELNRMEQVGGIGSNP